MSDTERYIVAAKLRPGATAVAERLLAAGPPFDPSEAGLSAHAAYLAADAVYLVFEGQAAHAKALQLANTHLIELGQWQSIVVDLPGGVADVPADARCIYRWPEDAP